MKTGLEIVSVSEFSDRITEAGEDFHEQHFDREEISYCESRADSVEAFAGHWAAKRALADTVDVAEGHRYFFIHHERTGRPTVQVDERLFEAADDPLPDGTRWDCSITHDAGMAVAFAVCVVPQEEASTGP